MTHHSLSNSHCRTAFTWHTHRDKLSLPRWPSQTHKSRTQRHINSLCPLSHIFSLIYLTPHMCGRERDYWISLLAAPFLHSDRGLFFFFCTTFLASPSTFLHCTLFGSATFPAQIYVLAQTLHTSTNNRLVWKYTVCEVEENKKKILAMYGHYS